MKYLTKKFFIVNRKIFFIIKIKLLYISFKILYSNIEDKIYGKTKLKGKLNFINNHVFFHRINEIKYVLAIYELSQNQAIQELARNIIKNKRKKIQQQYLHKFKYLYYNSLSYYKYSNLKLNYSYIATLNLYIIIKCYKNRNFLPLLEYLYNPFYLKN